ncbi:5-(carboxyamino)imidazole ribonucleotide synthase [Marininema halotolerans]|uniref:N5-carboxyaminoimidazole ribonucleotide synthase n=1 Tax=Marininema halotolerans TaxID=1155944 RepID=A0A1I6SE44_9BACL|nr:5-(carboxyamino)imidazole ribonucleotide synthase [Marininema halotolerans]SFS75241.1 5-(carboxyamino)imidazole ribonucleotide synthase [Marininema halotolerans]
MSLGLKSSTEKGSRRYIAPGSTVGILGGGQLGRMMILEGKKMGLRFITCDPATDCPGSQVADEHRVASFSDQQMARDLASVCDVITYEFENVDGSIARLLEEKAWLPQGASLLETTRHRLREKQALVNAGIPVAPYRGVTQAGELAIAIEEIGLPCVLKTVTGGYDGKGQQLIRYQEDIPRAAANIRVGETCIVEGFIPFIKELSVVVARGQDGEICCFPPVENIHKNHILHMTLAPAPVAEEINQAAEHLARRVAEELGVVGILAVEMFLQEDGTLLVNELAPRPHNSGHFTLDACNVSQFEQHLRAICGWPLMTPHLLTPAVMINVLGQDTEKLMKQLPKLSPEVKVHWYGKKESRTNRKMGHLTALGATIEEAQQYFTDDNLLF